MTTITHTPWGAPDHIEQIAPGIHFITTPSHGGYHLDPAQLAKIPPAWRRARFASAASLTSPWFEEDCDWALVALTFPDVFPPKAQPAARDIFNAVHLPKIGNNLLAQDLKEVRS